MGRKKRIKPARLSEKLLEIRTSLSLSQTEVLRRLGFEKVIDSRRISEFERDEAEPPLPVLLEYAGVAGVHMEDIVDDELDLPAKLPGNVSYQGLKRKSRSPKRNR